jgi:integrase
MTYDCDIYAASEPVAPSRRRRSTGAVSFERLSREVLELYLPSARAKTTRGAIVHTLKVLAELGVRSSEDLTVGLVARLVESRDPSLSSNTVLGLLRNVRVIANFAVASNYLRVSPFTIRKLASWCRPSPSRGKSHLTGAELRKILDVMHADVEQRLGWARWRAMRTQALIGVAIYTGMRFGEIAFLHMEDLDLEARLIAIVDRPGTHRTKTLRSAQVVTIPDALVPLLALWIENRESRPPGFNPAPSVYVFRNASCPTPWHAGAKGSKPLHRLQEIARRAGVDYASFKLLRRSYATALEGKGAGPLMVMRLLRHTTPTTAQKHYLKADVAAMRSVTDTLDF